MNETISLILLPLGTFFALAALALRRAGDLDPDPGDIQTREGMEHMLTGVFAWIAVLICLVAAVSLFGAIPAAIVIVAMVLMLRLKSMGGRGRPYYRTRLPLAIAALGCGLALLVALLETLQGALNV